ncbi:MAG TPA: valine--tRNA ligase [Thermoanaerobaculia bacterium]|nr:valine--tRNA ligase [Thermoanaerobaculia bacterium]
MREIPKSYDHRAVEKEWRQRWEAWGLHRFDPARPREESFVVDTPPPTVSGSLHVGHGFSYAHQDLIVRYQRMRGRNVAYPMGWDDNGLPTERRVQNVFGIRPNPALPYVPGWRPRRDRPPTERPEEVSRLNFIEACGLLTAEDERAFEETWRELGLSIDWTMTYATIDERSRSVSQLSFLDLYRKGRVYQSSAPTMWDVDFGTAVAQAEVEDRPRKSAYVDLRFTVEGEGGVEVTISTTRPELLGACVALAAHPDDERYRALFGRTAITPLYRAPVPIIPAEQADPEKGTGILMVCTFGDANDVELWKAKGLPLRQLVGPDGRIMPADFGSEAFPSRDPERARAAHAEIAGRAVEQARRRIVELLAQEGSAASGRDAALAGQPRPVEHPVKFYEKGDRPLEFLPARQWFVRILDVKEELLEQGRRIQWHPPHMRARYEHWVEGLNQDWCVSRQRFSGVAFPVWYPVRADGSTDYEQPILASEDELPVDPLASPPRGRREEERGQPGGFVGDPDVMDTWATSSLTPQILSGWGRDPELHRKLFPMDLRPQSHEIIRTWAFYTIVKAWMHERSIPWRHIMISGWGLDPAGKKMSKSKGNVVTPSHLFHEHSADAYRYWAARNRLGTDTVFDPEVVRVGKRLATKLFNASRFVLSQLDRVGADYSRVPVEEIGEELDLAFVADLRALVARSTSAFDEFDYALPLQASEELFWRFCDDFVELVKVRSYQEEDTPGRRSATAALHLGLRVFLRLFAPFLPYVTEEIWSWRFAAGAGAAGSIHLGPWPEVSEMAAARGPDTPESFAAAAEVLGHIRGAKTRAKRNLRWPVVRLEVRGPTGGLRALEAVLPDILRAGAVEDGALRLEEGPAPEGQRLGVAVALGEEPR